MNGLDVRVRRIYSDPEPGDGTRVLVDRLWPRGMSRDRAHLDEWCRAVAPSPDLRRWYAHDPARFDEFARRYRRELESGEQQEALDRLHALAARGPLTLLTATGEAGISGAEVLRRLLDGGRRPRPRSAAPTAAGEDPTREDQS
ncbi:MAG: DUF488 family protein [Gordonia sp. (in: high G+C Gram-positive bacteria)]|uniref:DUF488 domain-containing protein n=1 Tax=Gordonia sp. (in: high G+C Gram-positive bacteria) TaxID=84139 RepID=UPI0039E6685B